MPRPKGVPNRVTTQTRDAFRRLLEGEHENFKAALDAIRLGGNGLDPDPKGYMDVLTKIARFCLPELARLEHTGEGGDPLQIIVKTYGKDE